MGCDWVKQMVNYRQLPRIIAAFLLLLGICVLLTQTANAASYSTQFASFQGGSSNALLQDAIKSIPLAKLSAADREKVSSVLANLSVFRRLPIKSIDCDPEMYLFLVRHPDVVVNIWEQLRISRLQLRQLSDERFQMAEPEGAKVHFEYVYRSHDLHVVYGEGVYEGPLLARPVKGRGVLVLRTGYVRETNDRNYVTSRMDCFLCVEPAGAELLTKTVSPLLGKTVDLNFVQTTAFLGALSRTAELDCRRVKELAGRLDRVRPEVREEFSALAQRVRDKSATAARTENKSLR
jgi:hypothetical protein